jgi:hypothetical protein
VYSLSIFRDDDKPEPPAVTRWRVGGFSALVLVGSADQLEAAGVGPREMIEAAPGIWVSLRIP